MVYPPKRAESDPHGREGVVVYADLETRRYLDAVALRYHLQGRSTAASKVLGALARGDEGWIDVRQLDAEAKPHAIRRSAVGGVCLSLAGDGERHRARIVLLVQGEQVELRGKAGESGADAFERVLRALAVA